MNRSQARLLISAMHALTGGMFMEPEKAPLKSLVNAETDLKAKVNKPVNGYQVKQRKRKSRRKGGK